LSPSPEGEKVGVRGMASRALGIIKKVTIKTKITHLRT